ncbi:hypothetical protein CONLIGDRAFT_107989 [Coniochaeta ligniaria NRRL 30616]|uniref:Uncharacterized protein n=1 Tax=Coniochaeta ligniaria NRRL 30616 TaxID=1408157 RepID=A0A1J7J340_9PEZI|nr:hypothetical protein CONLIGDRAFT_107989 [Coniochaeta ligniaria NRRL 30616]
METPQLFSFFVFFQHPWGWQARWSWLQPGQHSYTASSRGCVQFECNRRSFRSAATRSTSSLSLPRPLRQYAAAPSASSLRHYIPSDRYCHKASRPYRRGSARIADAAPATHTIDEACTRTPASERAIDAWRRRNVGCSSMMPWCSSTRSAIFSALQSHLVQDRDVARPRPCT